MTSWQQEIIDLHVFFEDWLGAKISKTPENYARCEASLARNFCIINPSGTLSHQEPLLKALYSGHGSKENLIITIKNPSLHYETSDSLVATYEEWQSYKDTNTARLSTVVFSKTPSAHNGLLWQHVHETWLTDKL